MQAFAREACGEIWSSRHTLKCFLLASLQSSASSRLARSFYFPSWKNCQPPTGAAAASLSKHKRPLRLSDWRKAWHHGTAARLLVPRSVHPFVCLPNQSIARPTLGPRSRLDYLPKQCTHLCTLFEHATGSQAGQCCGLAIS